MPGNSTYNTGNGKTNVESMFDSIAWRYDFLNHFLSFGIDNIWRRRAIKIIARHVKNPIILDVATGTGDLAISAMKLNPVRITGIDISEGMLERGRKKIVRKGFEDKIGLVRCDSENMQFPDNTFDVAMAGFGVRNFRDILKGLSEMYRVLRPDGFLMILEFSNPQGSLFRRIYNFYFRRILPLTGRLFSGNRIAYSYLPDSVIRFPDNDKFAALLREAGFINTEQKRLTGGIVSIYTGFKPAMQ